jgi:DNA polymerase-3 subunit delta
MGEESYYIDEITNYIEKNALPEDEKSFNQTVFYGKDIDMGTLLNTARRFPMMSKYNVVILKEAQNLKGIDGVSKNNKDPFLLYVENLPESTIMVINYKGKSIDKRKKLYKVLNSNAVLMESTPLWDNKVAPWILKYIKESGYSMDLKAAELIASHLGKDLSKITQEIKKLVINIPKGTKITLKDIEDNIGISKDFNVFELQNAIGNRDIYRANLIINHMSKNPKTKSIIPIIAVLYTFFTKLIIIHSTPNKSEQALSSATKINFGFIKEYIKFSRNFSKAKCIYIIGFLREYDAKSKGIDSPPVDDIYLMRELVYKILHI